MKLFTSLVVVLGVACCTCSVKLSREQKLALLEDFEKMLEDSEAADEGYHPAPVGDDSFAFHDNDMIHQLNEAVETKSRGRQEENHDCLDLEDVGSDSPSAEGVGRSHGDHGESDYEPKYVPLVNKGPSQILAQVPTDILLPMKNAQRMFDILQSLQSSLPTLQKSVRQAMDLQDKPNGMQQFLRAIMEDGGPSTTGEDPTKSHEANLPPNYKEVMLDHASLSTDPMLESFDSLLHSARQHNPGREINHDDLEKKRATALSGLKQISTLLGLAGVENEHTQMFEELFDLMNTMNVAKPAHQPREPESQAETEDFIALEKAARRLREGHGLAHGQSLPSNLKNEKNTPPFFAEQQSDPEPEAKPPLANFLNGLLKQPSALKVVAQLLGESLPTLLKRQKDVPPYHATEQQGTHHSSHSQTQMSDILGKVASKFAENDAAADAFANIANSLPTFLGMLNGLQESSSSSSNSESPGNVIGDLLKNPAISETIAHLLSNSLPSEMKHPPHANRKEHSPEFEDLFNRVMESFDDDLA